MSAYPSATITGYPRLGRGRELKKALEAFWQEKISADEFESQTRQLRAENWQKLLSLGLDPQAGIPADFCNYDQVLATLLSVGAIPNRFGQLKDKSQLSLSDSFILARGNQEYPALEMTKWFDSNYHYLVPEISADTHFRSCSEQLVQQVTEAKELGITPRVVLVGPLTFLLLSKPASKSDFSPLDRLEDLSAVYQELLRDLKQAGAQWVQLDEPALAVDTWQLPGLSAKETSKQILAGLETSYKILLSTPERPQLQVAITYGDNEPAAQLLAKLGVEAIGLDLVRGRVPADTTLKVFADAGTTLVAGIVSGRNIWRTNLDRALETLQYLQAGLKGSAGASLSVSTSTSLLHVPHDLELETDLDPELKSWLAFADQKVSEVVTLALALQAGGLDNASPQVKQAFAQSREADASRQAHPGVNRGEIRARVHAVSPQDRKRLPYGQRKVIQDQVLNLPELPTTTIGSFPQTTQIRTTRAKYRQGKITEAQYTAQIQAEIAQTIQIQTELGLDVLVHGEAERNDMVQYFAENLAGFATTKAGWVQSYGSRGTRPSILWGDVYRPEPISVKWISYAQSLSEKPVKGMLTGPVTILAWSFVREDLDWGTVADQVALALRDEIADLEAARIKVIQVDEPAIRELLPLKLAQQEDYLRWAVDAFCLATGGAAAQTQIHTHLCYSEFNVILHAIDSLDADVTSIESARSRMDVLPEIKKHGFDRQLGPGIWDIHSPRIPGAEECLELLQTALQALPASQLWVNPDCGLKTRQWPETKAALSNLVRAARSLRS